MDQMPKVVGIEQLSGGVARITLQRPSSGNAQNVEMTYALNDALMAAAHNDAVRVIILTGEGRHFSTGHDLKDLSHDAVGREYPLTSTWGDIDTTSVHGWYGWEREAYLDMCRRWRDIAKPTIAAVQGACMGGGLMLAWACDLIVAAQDAIFADPVVNIGANGVEYFFHPWEIGSRRAKEYLFTAESWDAQQAMDWGMVNRVVPAADLQQAAVDLATKIASKPVFAIKMAKESVNAALACQGQREAVDRAFALHQLCHAHNRVEFGGVLDPSGLPAKIVASGTLSTLVAGTKPAKDTSSNL